MAGTVPGTIRLVGPYPSENVTVVTTSNGTFSVSVLPGAYSLYATGFGSAATRANLTSVLALPSTTLTPLTVALAPTWVDTISVAPPGGSSAGVGLATVTVTNSLGTRAVYANVSWNSPLALALPTGPYRITARASGSLGGVPTDATSSTTVTIQSGNVGTVLSLVYATTTSVSGTLSGPTSATVAAGGVATFSFSVRNTGNVPVTVHPVGTPSYWTFNFSIGNVTLLPGSSGSVVSGEVRVDIPSGTAVAHPTVTIDFVTSNGTTVGSVSPTPTVNVIGYYGLAVGPSTVPTRVGPSTDVVPYYIHNTGNTVETVLVTISDAPRLAMRGWSANLSSGATPGQVKRSLNAGDNYSLNVNLTATGSIFLPPESVTLSMTVLESNGGVSRSVTLSVPIATVRAKSANGIPPVSVTGPSLGSAPNLPPDWLVPLLSFVPVIALVVGVLTYRWWRTRRWTRR
jgi:hypothetical protein